MQVQTTFPSLFIIAGFGKRAPGRKWLKAVGHPFVGAAAALARIGAGVSSGRFEVRASPPGWLEIAASRAAGMDVKLAP